MKKTNILKIAFTFVLAFVIFGASAQILLDYDDDGAGTSYQTTGVDFRMYVYPDAVYNPLYVAATNAGVDADARWTWNLGGLAAAGPWVDNVTPIAQNYVEITAPAVGSYTITAAESSVLSGCTDGTPESQLLEVIAAPTADIAGAMVGAWTQTTADHEFYMCGDAVGIAENLTVTVTETGVLAADSRYAYYLQSRRVIIDASDVEVAATITLAALRDYTLAAAGKVNLATADGGIEVTSTGVMPVVTHDWGSGAVPSRTKYTFTLMKPSDAASAVEGIVSAISHKSDWLILAGAGDVTTYPFAVPADVSVTYIVNPTPITGPIYTIPSTHFN